MSEYAFSYTICEISCYANGHVAFGSSQLPTTSSMYIPANDIEIIKIRPGEKVAFIGSGDLYVTELSG